MVWAELFQDVMQMYVDCKKPKDPDPSLEDDWGFQSHP